MNIVLLILGLAVLGFGGFQLSKNMKLSKSGVKMEAEIVEIVHRRETDTDSDGYSTTRNVYYPIFKYEYEGKDYQKQSNVGAGKSNKYGIGDKLDIVFLPEKPEKAEVRGTMNMWIMPVVLIIVGLMLCILSFSSM